MYQNETEFEKIAKVVKVAFLVLALLIPILGITALHNFTSGIWDKVDGQIAAADNERR